MNELVTLPYWVVLWLVLSSSVSIGWLLAVLWGKWWGDE